MKSEPSTFPIKDLVELRKNSMLDVNAEYQRGAVWGAAQKKKLIDSILRGYPIPLIYLHDIKREVAGKRKENFEIIDGQQRLNAIYEFAEGAFALFHPVNDEKVAKFPKFVVDQPCPWGGKRFGELDADLQKKLLDMRLPVVLVETDNENEVRDLFVRLQSGLPLNAQETRDSWPGQFTDFILRLGGKPATDRGKARQLAAQLAVIYFARRESDTNSIPDIGAKAINDFYYQNVDFDQYSVGAKRFVEILDKITLILSDGKRSKLRAHDAIHIVLLVDHIWDDYTRGWESSLASALDSFLEDVAKGKLTKDSDQPSEFWSRYAQMTRVNSDRGTQIAQRHRFYLEKMISNLTGLVPKDPNRIFGELERTIIYYQAQKCCEVCGSEVHWKEAEIHHVQMHSKGGATVLSNGALVHKKCHPKSAAQVDDFAARFAAIKKSRASRVVMGGTAFDFGGLTGDDEDNE